MHALATPQLKWSDRHSILTIRTHAHTPKHDKLWTIPLSATLTRYRKLSGFQWLLRGMLSSSQSKCWLQRQLKKKWREQFYSSLSGCFVDIKLTVATVLSTCSLFEHLINFWLKWQDFIIAEATTKHFLCFQGPLKKCPKVNKSCR